MQDHYDLPSSGNDFRFANPKPPANLTEKSMGKDRVSQAERMAIQKYVKEEDEPSNYTLALIARVGETGASSIPRGNLQQKKPGEIHQGWRKADRVSMPRFFWGSRPKCLGQILGPMELAQNFTVVPDHIERPKPAHKTRFRPISAG